MAETQSPTHQAALEYIEHGLAVIPLVARDKVPASLKGLNDWSDNPDQINAWWTLNEYDGSPNYNVGIVCGQVSGGLVVIDLDAHGGADGRETLRDWEVANGELPETVTSITGSGGKHLLYRAPFPVRPSTNAALGVDIRGDGSYIVAPPSIHPNGERYEWSISPDDCDVATADDRVLAFIDYVRPAHADKFDAQGRYEPFALPERIGAGERNDTLFRYAAQLRSKEMGEGEILALLRLANVQHCDPPMSEGELAGIAQNVTARYAPGHSAEVRAIEERKAKAVPAELVTQEISVAAEQPSKLDKKGGNSTTTIETMVKRMTADEQLTSALRFDVHEKRRWKVAPIPMGDDGRLGPLTDADESALWMYCQSEYGWTTYKNFVHALNVFFARPELQRDRLREVMESMPAIEDAEDGNIRASWDGGENWTWEGRPRAGHLLKDWLDAEDTEYTQQAELLMLREIVGRALHPGCKADVMPVLYGGQGIGKSTFAQALAIDDRLFLPTFSKFDEEHLKRLPGHLIVEVGELAAFKWRDMNSIKDVLSTQKDVIRLPYAKNPVELQRTCVFIGTTNSHAFLNDSTGNRRFLPIVCNAPECKGGMRDPDGLPLEIEIAYGEILREYKYLGPEEFLRGLTLPKEVASEALAKQADFSEANKIADDLANWLGGLGDGERVNVKRFFMECYGYTATDWAKVANNETKDATDALDNMPGWHRIDKKQRVSGGGVSYGITTAWERD